MPNFMAPPRARSRWLWAPPPAAERAATAAGPARRSALAALGARPRRRAVPAPGRDQRQRLAVGLLTAQLDDLIAQQGGPLELHVLGRGLHLRLEILDQPDQLVLRDRRAGDVVLARL